MKKFILAWLLISACLLLTSCDLQAGKRPIDYNNTKWVSADLDIWFAVQDKHSWSCFGEINIDRIQSEIEVVFQSGTGIGFYTTGAERWDDYLFLGTCKFSEDKLVVTITNNSNYYLRHALKTITFERIDNTEPCKEDRDEPLPNHALRTAPRRRDVFLKHPSEIIGFGFFICMGLAIAGAIRQSKILRRISATGFGVVGTYVLGLIGVLIYGLSWINLVRCIYIFLLCMLWIWKPFNDKIRWLITLFIVLMLLTMLGLVFYQALPAAHT